MRTYQQCQVIILVLGQVQDVSDSEFVFVARLSLILVHCCVSGGFGGDACRPKTFRPYFTCYSYKIMDKSKTSPIGIDK